MVRGFLRSLVYYSVDTHYLSYCVQVKTLNLGTRDPRRAHVVDLGNIGPLCHVPIMCHLSLGNIGMTLGGHRPESERRELWFIYRTVHELLRLLMHDGQFTL